MEEGHWDLSKVDYDEVENHKCLDIRSDERTSRCASVRGIVRVDGMSPSVTWERRRTVRVTFCSSLIISSVSPKPVPRFRPCWDRMPSAVGYQPTLATEMGAMQERITSTRNGSITSVQAVYVPADDLTDPAPATTFTHLDATTVLSRKITELGIYPAVDPLESTSRILDPHIVG